MANDENSVYLRVEWSDVEFQCRYIYESMLLKNYKPDCIIGLTRGGVIPARILADILGISDNFHFMDVRFYNGVNDRKEHPVIRNIDDHFTDSMFDKKIIVVDDIWDSGKTMIAVTEYLKKMGLRNFCTATLFWKEVTENKPDYYAQTAKKNEWVRFPWEKYEFEKIKD